MRTVTFSDRAVGDALSKDFVCAWKNRIDGFHDCEPATEAWIFRSTAEAYTTRNICTFFLTPDLQVLHYVSGYLAPALYLDEIRFAQKLRRDLFDDDFKPKDGAAARFKELHAERARSLASIAETLGSMKNSTRALGELQYRGEPHKHSDACLGVVAEAYRYVAKVHEDLAAGGKGCGQDHAVVVEDPLAKKDEPPKDPAPLQTVWINATRAPKKIDRPEPRKEIPTHEAAAVEGIPVLSRLQKDYVYGNPFAEESPPARRVVRPKTKTVPVK